MPDILLTVLLVGLVPAYQVWLSLRRKPDRPDRVRAYVRTMGMATTLLAALSWVWLGAGRSPEALGFALPPAGEVGLALAALLLSGLLLYILLAKPSAKPAPDHVVKLMPSTPRETAVFLLMTLVIGTAWEVLFRGYLLWSLGGWIGIWPAVVVAAAAYGAAHGYKNRNQFIGSLVSALAFTTGYALTHSLWWLILIHTALPLAAALGMRRQLAGQALA